MVKIPYKVALKLKPLNLGLKKIQPRLNNPNNHVIFRMIFFDLISPLFF
jgi:hypothetical protein